jgi:hypothetical protein
VAGAPARTPLRRPADLPVVRTSPGIGPLVVLVAVVTVPLGLALMLDGTTYDTWGAFVWAPVLLALAFPLCRWVADRTGEPEIAGFLFFAAALKLVGGACARYYMVDAVYGAGDSFRYDDAAAELVEPFRRGVFENLGEITGTRFIEIVDGIVQAIIGQTMVGSFLVFSGFAFVGLCLLYLAFCEALPNGDRVIYRRLLFLTPTLWFWPSSVGKEAFLMLCIGATAYGFARLLNGHVTGIVLTGLGLWGAAVVRPHVALMLLVGAVAALPTTFRHRQADGERPAKRPLARFLVPILILAALPSILDAVEDFFDLQGLNVESATALRDEVVRRTSQGGSEFTPPDTGGPLGLAAGVVTVAMRPFPWEADGFQTLASIEAVGLTMIGVVIVLRRRLAWVRSLGTRWSRFALGYVVAFGWAFSAVSNFGIVSRQRSLMLPFAFVVLAAARRTPPHPPPRHQTLTAKAAPLG